MLLEILFWDVFSKLVLSFYLVDIKQNQLNGMRQPFVVEYGTLETTLIITTTTKHRNENKFVSRQQLSICFSIFIFWFFFIRFILYFCFIFSNAYDNQCIIITCFNPLNICILVCDAVILINLCSFIVVHPFFISFSRIWTTRNSFTACSLDEYSELKCLWCHA